MIVQFQLPSQSAMPLYWLCYRHNNQTVVVIEPRNDGSPLNEDNLKVKRMHEAGSFPLRREVREIEKGLTQRSSICRTIKRSRSREDLPPPSGSAAEARYVITTHALFAREVQRKLSNGVAGFAAGR